MIHLKSFIGRLIAPTGKFWYAHVQRLMQMCSNDQSEYIVVPSGRKHFFGELKLRSDFLCAQKRKFEDHEFLFPKNIDWYLSYMYGNYWIYDILTIPNHDLVGLSDRPIIHYNTYEEALEAGLQEALKLI